MNFLNLNYSNKILLSSVRFLKYELRALIRTASDHAKKKDKLRPISMSYASYESTQTTTGTSSPPLIIMHGLFGSKGNWNSLCKAIQAKSRPQRKIIAVDSRNHGDSPHSTEHSYDALAHDIKELMQSQNIKIASLLGHSMGGRAMMAFALKHPELVERLIVVDISPSSTSPSILQTFKFFGILQNIQIEKNLPLSAARQQADTFLAKSINDKGLRSFLLTNLVRNSDGSFSWRMNIAGIVANYQKIATFPKMENVKFEGPTLFLAGGSSDFIQKSDHVEILKLFPNSEFKTVEGAGHWVHSEKPTEFLEIVLEFINRDIEKH